MKNKLLATLERFNFKIKSRQYIPLVLNIKYANFHQDWNETVDLHKHHAF